ncbi:MULTISPECIES: methionine ABC transporter permease [unclassified Anaerotruncus]|jgi:D-methionine transport system permease protein|uniref:methionine ABC transporter permease n=1 Tax=unclassified Anaerotruncus TaxID=2641626 RepID=UPI000337AB95|nr:MULTISPECIES: methionine ABC transporter permease [unclassified Anaerotruncus]MCI9161506.1 ABC transporter permease [Anaerotruncus sp.]NCE74137.1 ABC transporter permease [Anaerotruncus sp. X29]RKK00039.1 ABC transporter permease [Anaerotruncus sp. 1XD22-93]EOS59744.1 hypothetical protein C814_01796 [Anaerotruncus sp. G3(2012)]MCI9235595.1 ABC transporter permease [Anaerotruncus sp.]
MIETIQKFAPLLWENTLVTLGMVGASTLFAYLLGLPMGVLLRVTDRGGIMENHAFNSVFGWVVNILRSLPFIILMISISPFTRLLVGKAIGPVAACVPLVIGAAPFVARLVETSLAEIDTGMIEAAKCMGATNWQIISKVMVRESVPSLIRGLSISTITILGYSAMAGAIGGGGLGDVAIRYGQHRFEPKVMLLTIILLVIIVCVIQIVFDRLSTRLDKRNR